MFRSPFVVESNPTLTPFILFFKVWVSEFSHICWNLPIPVVNGNIITKSVVDDSKRTTDGPVTVDPEKKANGLDDQHSQDNSAITHTP